MQKLALVLFFLAIFACGSPKRKPTKAQNNSAAITVLSFNVNFGLRADRITIKNILKARPQVVVFQETNNSWRNAALLKLKSKYPHQAFLEHNGAGGLGLVSAYPIKSKQYVENPKGWFSAGIYVLETDSGPLQILNVHLRPPVSDSGSWVSGYFTTGTFRRQEIAYFFTFLEPNLPTLVAGDFNEDIDGAANKFLEQQGFTSALPEFQPYAKTWHWPIGFVKLSGRLDHISYNKKLRPLNAGVLKVGHSDHFPIWAAFEMKAQ